MSEPNPLIAEVPPVVVYADEAPSPETETKTDGGEAKRDAAWRMGDQFQWDGQPLAPFAVDREGDWRCHRAALGLPELGRVMSEAFLADAIRIVYFCAHEPRQWLRLLSDPERLELEIRSWAASAIRPGQQGDITALAIGIFNSAYTNRATAREQGDGLGE